MSGLLDAGYEAETDDGPTWAYPLERLMETARHAAGDNCPKCGHHCKLFFGDPAGEHWCVCCQLVKELQELQDKEVTPRQAQNP